MREAARRNRRSQAVLPAVLAGALLCVASCRRPREAPQLRIGHESDVISIDPIAPPESVTGSVLANVFEPLVAFDRDMVLVPKLAVGWETTDPTTWVLRLRTGVRFQDGTPMTAHEVRTALERARNHAESGLKGILFSVRAIEEVDPTTVVLTTSRPDPLLLNRLTQIPVARAAEGGFVGTGPYRVVRWTKGKSLETAAWAGYWGGAPQFSRVVFVPVDPGPPMISALRGGAVDVVRFVPENLVGEVKAIPGVRVAARTGLTSTYLWLDARDGRKNPFADARVRRAVSLAIDRAAIVKALSGNALALEQTIPRGIFGHVASLPPLRYAPDEARRLLREAGWGAGFATPLAHATGPSSERVAALVAKMLADVGIRATLRPWASWPAMFAEWRAARLPLFTAGWRFDNGDAASFLQDCLVTRARQSGFGANNPGYSNPRLDRLVDESERVIEPAKRMALYEEIARVLADDMPVVPLYHRYNLFALSDRLRWEPRLDGRILVGELAPVNGKPKA